MSQGAPDVAEKSQEAMRNDQLRAPCDGKQEDTTSWSHLEKLSSLYLQLTCYFPIRSGSPACNSSQKPLLILRVLLVLQTDQTSVYLQLWLHSISRCQPCGVSPSRLVLGLLASISFAAQISAIPRTLSLESEPALTFAPH
jgi:hypothetical protein